MIATVERYDDVLFALSVIDAALAKRFEAGVVQHCVVGKIVNFTLSNEEFVFLVKACAKAESKPSKFARKTTHWEGDDGLSVLMALKDYLRLYDGVTWGDDLFDRAYDSYLDQQPQSVVPKYVWIGLLVVAVASFAYLLFKLL